VGVAVATNRTGLPCRDGQGTPRQARGDGECVGGVRCSGVSLFPYVILRLDRRIALQTDDVLEYIPPFQSPPSVRQYRACCYPILRSSRRMTTVRSGWG